MPTFGLISSSLQAPEVLSTSFLFFFFCLILSSPGSEDEATCNFLKTIFKSYFFFLVGGSGLAKASRLASGAHEIQGKFWSG